MDFKGVVVEVALTSLLSWYGKNQVLTKFGHSSQIGELWSVNDIFRGSWPTLKITEKKEIV